MRVSDCVSDLLGQFVTNGWFEFERFAYPRIHDTSDRGHWRAVVNTVLMIPLASMRESVRGLKSRRPLYAMAMVNCTHREHGGKKVVQIRECAPRVK